MDVESTPLPGIGTCRTFHTATGHRVGVITHHAGGRRELVHSISEDPDAACSLTLTRAEATALAGLLGILDVIDVDIAGPDQHTPPRAPR